MKLIDILVQELPKCGGWPEGAEIISMHADGVVYINKKRTFGLPLPQCTDGWDRNKHTPNYTNEVTREQYEAALKQPVWNGTGLPPVGVECEYRFPNVNYRSTFSRGKVLAYGAQKVFMEHWSSKNEFIQPLDNIEFRPIRSERDDFIRSMIDFDKRIFASLENRYGKIYDAIAAGEIPGVKLSD